jgi:hypothetical protein
MKHRAAAPRASRAALGPLSGLGAGMAWNYSPMGCRTEAARNWWRSRWKLLPLLSQIGPEPRGSAERAVGGKTWEGRQITTLEL